VLSEVLKPIINKMHLLGHKVIRYVDDWLIVARSPEECSRATQDLLGIFKELGVIYNAKKSVLVPAQSIEYLGNVIDSVSMTVMVPKKKLAVLRKNLKALGKRALQGGTATPRELSRVIGKIRAMNDALFSTRVHTHGLHAMMCMSLHRSGWDCPVAFSEPAVADISWWVKNLGIINGKAVIPKNPNARGTTDASDHAWGFEVTNRTGQNFKVNGAFPLHLQRRHINFKELLVIRYLLETCGEALKNQIVSLGIDNMVALSYINKLGGKIGKLASLADQIFGLMRKHRISIQGYYIPSEENVVADRLSRMRQTTAEWKLNPKAFKMVSDRWGPHSIDLFATRENRQIKRFASWKLQPGASWTDSMVHPWTGENAYANPPPNLLSKILAKVKDEKVKGMTLIAPLWWSRTWISTLVEMSSDLPMFLPRLRNLQLNHVSSRLPSSCPVWPLVAWRISGDACEVLALTRKLSKSCSKFGRKKLTNSMRPPGSRGKPSASVQNVFSLILQR
jgi:hypothetical protein